MGYQKKSFLRTWLIWTVIIAGACSFELPEKVRVVGSPSLSLPLGGYEYPKNGEKLIDLSMIKESLGGEVQVGVYDYDKPGSDTQTFLIHYNQTLAPFTFDLNEYSFMPEDDDLDIDLDLDFDLPAIEDFVDVDGIIIGCSLTIADEDIPPIPPGLPSFTLPCPIPVSTPRESLNDNAGEIDSRLKEILIGEGYIYLSPPDAYDLTGVKVNLYEGASLTPIEGVRENPGVQPPIYKYDLNGISISKDMEIELEGGVRVTITPETLSTFRNFNVTVEPDIVSLDALVEIEPQVEEQSIDFDLPQGIQEVTFKKLGANLLMDVGLPVEGLGLQAGMEFYTTANGSGEPAFTVPFPPLENFSLPASEQFIGIAGDTTIPPADYAGELSNIKSAKIKITANPQINDSNREIWVRGIGPESVIDVNATAAAVVEVDSAKINLNDFIPEENRSSSFPGEGDGFNFADLTGSLEDMVNLDSLEFEGINLYVYLSGLDDDPDVPDVQKLNIWDTRPGLNLTAVDRSEGAGEPTSITNNITNSLDPLDGFEPLVTGDRPLVFSEKDGDVVSGGLPDATFSTDKLTRILNSKPGNMYIKYDFKFGEPFPIKMSFLEGEEPIVKNIAVDIVLELPLKLRLLPLEEGADYGALRYISKETEDLLGREQGADDPFSDYTKYLDFASLEISYENTLGLYGAQLVLLDKNNPDNPDFAFVKELDPLQEQGTINITLRGNEIPNPFIPIVEVRVPLEPDKPYGIIEVKRGTAEVPAGLKAISIRVKAQGYIDEEFSFSEFL